MSAIATVMRPVPAVIAVIFNRERVLLVRRANPPDAGKWGFPGGKVEWGETLMAATEREVLEETGLHVRARTVITAVDCLDPRETPVPERHFVLVAMLCQRISGEVLAGDDALEARWFSPSEYEHGDLAMSLDVLEVIRAGRSLLTGPFAAAGEHHAW